MKKKIEAKSFKLTNPVQECNLGFAEGPITWMQRASGYALFERVQAEEIGQEMNEKNMLDLSKFGKVVKLKSFAAFKSAAHALENIMDVSEAVCNDYLKSFLETNLPKTSSGKSSKFKLGVGEKNFAGAIKQELNCECVSDDIVIEILRGLRLHGEKMLKGFKDGDLGRAQLGLGHAYSRSKVKFNVNRSDNMIIQAICLLDQLDKDVNTFSMRCKEWYGWHFPELVKIVADNGIYAKLVKFIKNKNDLSDEHLDELEVICGDSLKAKQILDAARASMGTDISPVDMINVESFSDRVISLTDYRKNLYEYLVSKMHTVAPNLSALIGEVVGARLISHAGSLTNLAKYPASTVQILGAEKALFRALKTKGNTPKYGLIYHSTFIGRAAQKNKGRISRFLANKCSIASRIDHFVDIPTSKFGEVLKEQVEERLKFYEEGTKPRTNDAVMQIAVKNAKIENGEVNSVSPKKRKNDEMDIDEEEEKPKAKKSKKKEKKSKPEKNGIVEEAAEISVEKEKKVSKKDKKKEKKSKA
ncbi:snoRNP complex protein nop56 [Clydaea vesicula]|uniref:Nucleolar protein 56 n=1 Tax=Clydaea vesicula TaxID=447962 RepID=A0AAD5XZV9_9FUNG|nr:snoRNP complex protein nop56 [Clydaea vesicula]